MATILVIDDRPSNRHYLVTLLGYSGHRLLEASNGTEGLAQARAERPDLVITDILMPEMDGFEFVRYMRADPAIASTSVIFYSATYHPQEVRALADACGVSHILPKPSEPPVILETVHAALGLPVSPPAPLPREEFDREHMRLLTDTLAHQVTALEDTSQRLRDLINLGQELAAERTPLRLLERVCQAARELIGAQYAALGVLDDTGQAPGHIITSGFTVATVAHSATLSPSQGVLGTLLSQRSAQRLHGLQGDPQAAGLPPQYPPVHAFLGVPIMTAEHVYGWLCLLNKLGAEAFSEEDEQLTVTLAMQAALAYENIRRYDAIESHATQLEREVVRREWAEEELRQAKAELESRVAERTAALQDANAQLATRAHQLEQRNREVILLSELGSLLQGCLTAAEAYTVIAQCGPRLFPTESGALYVFSASRYLLEAVAVWGEAPVGEVIFIPNECWALRRGRMHVVTDPRSGLLCQHVSPRAAGVNHRAPLTTSYLCAPMMAQGEALGVLHLRSSAPPPDQPASGHEALTDTQQRLAEAVVDHIALALANVHLRQTLHIQSTRDPLTDLFNRRYMEESLEREVRRAVRQGYPIGVIMLDLDRFKGFNDAFGHVAGDALLRAVGHLLTTNSRAEDIACRYGGEEFTLILPGAPLEVTQRRAENLRLAITHLRIQHSGQELETVTMSLGIATFPEHASTPQGLIHVADAALYRAKAAGRNRVLLGQGVEE